METLALRVGPIHMAFTDRGSNISLPPEDIKKLGRQARFVTRRSRRAVALRFGLQPDSVVYLRQVHGAEVRYTDEPFEEPYPAADGVCTSRAGLALAVLAADCAPVLLGDPVSGVVGAAHAGRAGVLLGVVPALVGLMKEQGADLRTTVALIGPSACGSCYEVSADIRADMSERIPEAWSTSAWGTPSVDIRRAVTAQILRSGIVDIRHDYRCTIETSTLFSYRREGPTGDFGGYVWRALPARTTNSRNAV